MVPIQFAHVPSRPMKPARRKRIFVACVLLVVVALYALTK